jgi:N-acylneuraminate-9-phosphatase
MLKAILLDMDETICDTTKANILAMEKLAVFVEQYFPSQAQAQDFSKLYLKGIYKNISDDLKAILFPIEDESEYRTKIVHIFLKECGATQVISDEVANKIRLAYDEYRIQEFNFFKGCLDLLKSLRAQFTLVVITNGPVYSQVPKVESINLEEHVDHIIIGGMEPEEKPYISIFNKALKLAGVSADEAIHIGDSLEADIVGANNSKIKSVWINPKKLKNTHANFSIENILQLPSIIEQF